MTSTEKSSLDPGTPKDKKPCPKFGDLGSSDYAREGRGAALEADNADLHIDVNDIIEHEAALEHTLLSEDEEENIIHLLEEDSGMDIRSSRRMQIPPRGWAIVPTGIYLEIPAGQEIQVRSRSGLALKRGISVLNSPGTVDRGYSGECGVILMNYSDEVFDIEVGDRIAQIVLCPVTHCATELVEELDIISDRGAKGLGSTGVQ
jgi:dUTP pyrophosphatase